MASFHIASFHITFHTTVFIFIFIFYLLGVSIMSMYLFFCFLSHSHNVHHCFLYLGLEISKLLHLQPYFNTFKVQLHLSHQFTILSIPHEILSHFTYKTLFNWFPFYSHGHFYFSLPPSHLPFYCPFIQLLLS